MIQFLNVFYDKIRNIFIYFIPDILKIGFNFKEIKEYIDVYFNGIKINKALLTNIEKSKFVGFDPYPALQNSYFYYIKLNGLFDDDDIIFIEVFRKGKFNYFKQIQVKDLDKNTYGGFNAVDEIKIYIPTHDMIGYWFGDYYEYYDAKIRISLCKKFDKLFLFKERSDYVYFDCEYEPQLNISVITRGKYIAGVGDEFEVDCAFTNRLKKDGFTLKAVYEPMKPDPKNVPGSAVMLVPDGPPEFTEITNVELINYDDQNRGIIKFIMPENLRLNRTYTVKVYPNGRDDLISAASRPFVY